MQQSTCSFFCFLFSFVFRQKKEPDKVDPTPQHMVPRATPLFAFLLTYVHKQKKTHTPHTPSPPLPLPHSTPHTSSLVGLHYIQWPQWLVLLLHRPRWLYPLYLTAV
jgi:hypothetical protein